MIEDFYLGLLVATTVALGIIVTAGAMLAAWLVGWLSKYAAIDLRKDQKGAVSVSAEVRGR